MAVVETKHFRSAKKFIEYLRRGNAHWWDDDSTEIGWVFRGQWDASWPLTPKAWPDVEHVLRRVAEHNGFNDVVLHKLTLPGDQADELLKLIDREGINQATLMPTHDMVAATLKSRWKSM